MESLGDWLDERDVGGTTLTVAPWKSRRLVLLHIAQDGTATSVHNISDKRQVAQRTDGRLFVVWPGEHATMTREATAEEWARLREIL